MPLYFAMGEDAVRHRLRNTSGTENDRREPLPPGDPHRPCYWPRDLALPLPPQKPAHLHPAPIGRLRAAWLYLNTSYRDPEEWLLATEGE